MKVRFATVLVLLIGISACNYSKDYFRIGPDGKKIKADGPIVPGEDTGGGSGDGSGTGGSATGDTGGDGTITPTGGAGTAGTTGGGNGDPAGTPVYPLAIHAETSKDLINNLYFARFSEGAFLEEPKKLTANTDSNGSIFFPSLSPDASKILYYSVKGKGSIFDGTFQTDGGLRLISDISGSATEVAWNESDPGFSASWTANGEEAVYVGGGCGLLRKAKAGGTDAVDEGKTANGVYDKWFYVQATASPVREASHPAFNTVIFSMLGAEGATKQGFELFLKKLGDSDPSHFTAVTASPSTIELYPSISPDGKFIAFSALESSPSSGSSDSPSKIAICDLVFTSGIGNCQNTRTFEAMPANSQNSSPCWSWDSSKIFFTSKDNTTKKSDVFVVNVSSGSFGGSAVNVTNTADQNETEVSCASAPHVK